MQGKDSRLTPFYVDALSPDIDAPDTPFSPPTPTPTKKISVKKYHEK